MNPIAREVAELPKLGVKLLQQRCAELFGESTNCHNKVWLVKRIAWRMQVQSEGGLSERARQRAAEIADETQLRLGPPKRTPCHPRQIGVEPKPNSRSTSPADDKRLPPPGSLLTRAYKGQRLEVEVLAEGFIFNGERFASLTAVAKHITGSQVNGYRFFKLGGAA
ncbi:MAG: DUF2924 domain-containing protein [Gemmataceae bacterium]